MRSRISGNVGLLLAIVLAFAMSAVEFFTGTQLRSDSGAGICLPSPNLWRIPGIASWILGIGLTIILGLALHLFNKTYNFVSSSDTVLSASFIFLCGSSPWINGALSSSVLMVAANMICLHLIFGCYRSQKGMQQLFLIGSILSLCSMFQYAFIFLIPAYIVMAMVLKCLNVKSLIAMLMGIAAPYWIGIGLGIVPLDTIRMPDASEFLAGSDNRHTLFIGLLNCAVTILLSLMLALHNAVRLYAGNTRRRLLNNSVIILGLTAAICIVCDTGNIPVYLATVYMVLAVQIANLFALRKVHYARTMLFFIMLLYMASFVLMETGLNLNA